MDISSIMTKIKTTPLVLGLMMPHYLYAQGIQFNLQSPIGEITIEQFIVNILNFFIIIATPIVVLFIIYSGFLYVTARGNVEQTKKATTSLTYAIIGGVLIIGALALSEIIAGVVESFR
jgi:cytochrome bd-type quinol oxidase subunit 2